jgi:hypothetical protein
VRSENAQASAHPLAPTDELGKATLAAGGEGPDDARSRKASTCASPTRSRACTDGQVAELLAFGEKVIEGFRNQFVDPYLSETFKDRIPEGLFQEFYFGPEDVAFHEKFITEYYGLSWGDDKNRQRRLDSLGNAFLRTSDPRLISVWRLPGVEDLRGIVAHTLGHALADYHFNGGPARMDQPWIEEGLGYYLSFEFLGRNTNTCSEFRESLYGKSEADEGVKEVVVGYRDIMTKVALDEGQRIDRVMLKNLADMENPDLAKAWSFVEYLARTGGRRGPALAAHRLRARARAGHLHGQAAHVLRGALRRQRPGRLQGARRPLARLRRGPAGAGGVEPRSVRVAVGVRVLVVRVAPVGGAARLDGVGVRVRRDDLPDEAAHALAAEADEVERREAQERCPLQVGRRVLVERRKLDPGGREQELHGVADEHGEERGRAREQERRAPPVQPAEDPEGRQVRGRAGQEEGDRRAG